MSNFPTEPIKDIGQALSIGGSVTLVGMVITFGVLVILMLVLMAMKKIFYKGPEMPQAPVVKEVPKKKKKVELPVDVSVQELSCDDEELIAIFAAAIAASLNTSTYNLKIKSFRRVKNNAPAWKRAGMNEVINSRL